MVLLDDDSIWLAQLSLHPLNDRPDQLFLFGVQVFHTAWILAHRHDLPRDRRDSRLELQVLAHGTRKDLDRHFLIQRRTNDLQEAVQLCLLVLRALSGD